MFENRDPRLAFRLGLIGIGGIAVGVVAGLIVMARPDVLLPPPAVYAYATPLGAFVATLLGVSIGLIGVGWLGFHVLGAVGDGWLGKVATILSAIGNFGSAAALIHAAAIGANSDLIALGFFTLPGWILLTVAALRARRVSTLTAFVPVISLVVLMAIEFGAPDVPVLKIVHQATWGLLCIVVVVQAHARRTAMAPMPA